MAACDTVVRAITNDGAFRVITARTTDTVRGMVAAQRGRGSTARSFGDLITGAVLYRETMAPSLRVQGIVKRGRARLVADSHPSGRTRGLIQSPPDAGEAELGGDALLQLMRTLPDGRVSQGFVELPEEGGVSQALMAYMQRSEQVLSTIAVSTLIDDDRVLAAGGYMVQLLPEAERGPLMLMTERLRDFTSIDHQLMSEAFCSASLLDELLDGMPYTRLDESSLGFECWCSELRLMSALSTLPRAEIEGFLRDGSPLEISCDYCGTGYEILPERLRGLLETN
jgi:molecular chaperone Hsp33